MRAAVGQRWHIRVVKHLPTDVTLPWLNSTPHSLVCADQVTAAQGGWAVVSCCMCWHVYQAASTTFLPVLYSHAGLQAMQLIVDGHIVTCLDISLLGVCCLKVHACWRWEAAEQRHRTCLHTRLRWKMCKLTTGGCRKVKARTHVRGVCRLWWPPQHQHCRYQRIGRIRR
jgi:hypothetical protein